MDDPPKACSGDQDNLFKKRSTKWQKKSLLRDFLDNASEYYNDQYYEKYYLCGPWSEKNKEQNCTNKPPEVRYAHAGHWDRLERYCNIIVKKVK